MEEKDLVNAYLEAQSRFLSLNDKMRNHFLPLVKEAIKSGNKEAAKIIILERIPESPCRFELWMMLSRPEP